LFRALEWCERTLKLYFVAQVPQRSPSEKLGGVFYFGRMLDKSGCTPKANCGQIVTPTWERALMKNA
jgi:hypothetical protein